IRIGEGYDDGVPNPTVEVGMTILNNYVHHAAVEYRGGPAITLGAAAQTTVSHNEIAWGPYDGISMGWGVQVHDNVLAYNHVHHQMQVLNDGACIYVTNAHGVSATQGRSSVHDNYVHDQGDGSGGLYFDDGSAYLDVYHNVLQSVAQWLTVSEHRS